MHAIQENEIDQLRELSKFLEMETRFAEQYLDVLRDVKDDWIDEFVATSTIRKVSNSSTALPWNASLLRDLPLAHSHPRILPPTLDKGL